MQKTWRIHVLILTFTIGLVLLVKLPLREHYRREEHRIGRQASQEQVNAIRTRWKSFAYSNAAEPGVIECLIEKLEWPSLQLSNLQQETLKQKLEHLLRYLRDPTLEQYWSLRTEGLSYRLEFSPRAMEVITNSPAPDLGRMADEPRFGLKLLWDGVHRGKTPPRLTAICLDHIAAAVCQTNSVTSLLQGKVAKGFTAAFESTDPGFLYDGLPQGSSRVSPPVIFQLSFYAKATSSPDAGPLYLSLCWVEGQNQWALCRLVSDSLLDVSTIF